MVVDQQADANRVFAALADPTRRDILSRVLREEASVSALADGYAMSFAAVQKHVAVLEKAGLVSKQTRGRERMVRGELRTLHEAARLLDHFEEIWRGRLDRIDALLEQDKEL